MYRSYLDADQEQKNLRLHEESLSMLKSNIDRPGRQTTRLQLKLLNSAGKNTIQKIFSITKISDYLQHHENQLYTDPASIKHLLYLYKVCLGNIKSGSYNQKDLQIFWNLIEAHENNEEIFSLFILLLSEVVAKSGGNYVNLLIQCISNKKNISPDAIIRSLTKAFRFQQFINDEQWIKVFNVIHQTFNELKKEQDKFQGINKMGKFFVGFLQEIIQFINKRQKMEKDVVVNQAVRIFTDFRMNDLLFKLLKKLESLSTFMSICSIQVRNGQGLIVQKQFERILAYQSIAVGRMNIIDFLRENEDWAKSWAQSVINNPDIEAVAIFLQSRDGFLIFNSLIFRGMHLFKNTEHLYAYIMKIDYGKEVQRFVDDEEVKKSVTQLGQLMVEDPREFVDTLFNHHEHL